MVLYYHVLSISHVSVLCLQCYFVVWTKLKVPTPRCTLASGEDRNLLIRTYNCTTWVQYCLCITSSSHESCYYVLPPAIRPYQMCSKATVFVR